MDLTDLLRDAPPPRSVTGIREQLRRRLASSSTKIAVIDDDPTGTQTVHGVWVTTEWDPALLGEVLRSPESVFYVSTNSRALDPATCEALSLHVGQSLRAAAGASGVRVVLASRSDSTLRGHFPGEIRSLCRGLGVRPSAMLLAPAFFEGGRYTVGDVHYVVDRGGISRAADTEFAHDPTFAYRSSNLREWVEEKTAGLVRAKEVASLPLELIRSGGIDAVVDTLRDAGARAKAASTDWPLGAVVVVNAACYDDLDVVAAAASIVESEGTPLAYRCAASFVKSRGGFTEEPLLRGSRLVEHPGAGLVVVGSYVDRTTRQLRALLEAGFVSAVELDVDRLVDPARSGAAVRAAAECIDHAIRSGECAVVYTSRSTHLTSREGFLELGRIVMRGLCGVARSMAQLPAWVVAKGGITSIEVARALGVRRAWVLGQVAKGVPVWRLGEDTRLPGAPYVVFPGNVGDDGTLLEVVSALRAADRLGDAEGMGCT